MATPTTPPLMILPALMSTAIVPPGAPGNNLPAGVGKIPPPWNQASGTRFILPGDPNIVPNSTVRIEAEIIMSPTGTPSPPPPKSIITPLLGKQVYR
jgi:hypothetical protein